MKPDFISLITLASILLVGMFGLFLLDDAFAQNLSMNNDDSKAEEKQKELEQTKAERQEKAEEKQKELEQTKAERQEKAEEKQKELEQTKAELAINRENLEVKQLKNSQKYEEKLKEIKEKLQNKTKTNISNDEKFSLKSKQVEEKLIKKSEEIQQRLAEKSDKLDSRTKNILDKINEGQYMGTKITSNDYGETYELIFDFVNASLIIDQSQKSLLTGKMTFTLYDKSKSDLKLELDECEIIVDEIIYNCGFGKARTVSSGQSGAKDSLVIMAFLEDGMLEELHATMKLFVNAEIPINNIDQSQVSIIGPQSKISNLWFLNGTATLTKITPTIENTILGNNVTTSLQEGMSFGDK